MLFVYTDHQNNPFLQIDCRPMYNTLKNDKSA